jgi:hypothetical protein
MAEDLATLDRRITDALAALRRARRVVERSANGTTRWREDMAERTLDGLLEQRSRAQSGRAREPAGAAPGSRTDG